MMRIKFVLIGVLLKAHFLLKQQTQNKLSDNEYLFDKFSNAAQNQKMVAGRK